MGLLLNPHLAVTMLVTFTMTSASANHVLDKGKATLYTQLDNKVMMMEQIIMPSGEILVKQWNRSSEVSLETGELGNGHHCSAIIDHLGDMLENSEGEATLLETIVTLTDCLNQPDQNWAVLILWPAYTHLQDPLRLFQGLCLILNALLGLLILYKICSQERKWRKRHSTKEQEW